jgi:hypothetical protein
VFEMEISSIASIALHRLEQSRRATALLVKWFVLALAACDSSAPPPAPRPRQPPAPDPQVDMACVEKPARFHVTATADGAHLHRDGRALTDAEAESVWQKVQQDVFVGGLASGSIGTTRSTRAPMPPRTTASSSRSGSAN